MFKELFNIGKQKPEVRVAAQVKPEKPAFILEAMNPKSPEKSPKISAMKAFENLLDELENVNNPKVDSLRKLFVHLNTKNDKADLIAFLKQPVASKKRKKKETQKLFTI